MTETEIARRNNWLLEVTLRGMTDEMERTGLSAQTVALKDVTEVMTPLQLADRINPTGAKTLATVLADGRMLQKGADRYNVNLLPNLKKPQFPLVEIERYDPDLQILSPRVKDALKVLEPLNQVPFYRTPIAAKIGMAMTITQDGTVELMQFTCPTIKPTRILGVNPALYINTTAEGSNFESAGRDRRIEDIVKGLKRAGLTPRLRVIIGDTDEEAYLFPVIGTPKGMDPVLAEERRQLYRDDLEARIKLRFPDWFDGDGESLVQVERISEIEKRTKPMPGPVSLDDSQTQQDMEIEVRQMRSLFGAEGYYRGLLCPTGEQLREIVNLKFQTYADQGFRLAQVYPYAVFMQNEIPLELRTRMVNRGLQQYGRNDIGAIYPYGEGDR